MPVLKNMEISSDVTIARQQTRKDRGTQPIDHGRLRWAIFKIIYCIAKVSKEQVVTLGVFSWPNTLKGRSVIWLPPLSPANYNLEKRPFKFTIYRPMLLQNTSHLHLFTVLISLYRLCVNYLNKGKPWKGKGNMNWKMVWWGPRPF